MALEIRDRHGSKLVGRLGQCQWTVVSYETNALHYARYNLVRIHRTLRMTPAMAAGVTDRLWSVTELIETAT